MSVELSLSGKRIFLLVLGLVLAGVLLFATGMLVEAGRLRRNANEAGTGLRDNAPESKPSADAGDEYSERATAARLASEAPTSALPSLSTRPGGRGAAQRRLRPSLLPARPHRLSPVPILDQPPSPIG